MPQTDRIQVCSWGAQRVRDHRQLMVFALVSLPKREHRTVNFLYVRTMDYAADHLTNQRRLRCGGPWDVARRYRINGPDRDSTMSRRYVLNQGGKKR